jgi:hypothetical protein
MDGAAPARLAQASPGKCAGQDNGWAAALIVPVVMGFNKSIVDFPSKKRRSLDGLAAQSPNARQPGAIAGYEKAATG